MTAKVYYVVTHRGLPHSVYSYEHKALEVAREVSVKGAPAEVVAVSPLQQELPLESTEPEQEVKCSCGLKLSVHSHCWDH